ncbi:MAG TPA: hypothetical protein ENJ52_03235 [Aliiroseovarius sp.]|nr:hypothetical protein [Aliiroseovarius sp.]
MKKALLIAALTLPATTALAGTEAAPQMDVQMITQGVGSIEQSWLVPVVFLGILLLVMSGAGGLEN